MTESAVEAPADRETIKATNRTIGYVCGGAILALMVYLGVSYSVERQASRQARHCLVSIDVFSDPIEARYQIHRCMEEYERHRPFWYDVYNPVSGP